MRAHEAFDPLWKSKAMKRREAYRALAVELGIEERKCHISWMNATEADRVPAAVERIRLQLAEQQMPGRAP